MNDPLRQLAMSTEESAVRERFDAHNTAFGRLVSVPLIFVCIPLVIAYITNGVPLKLGGSILLLATAVTLYLVCSTWRRLERVSGALRRAAGPNLSLWIVGLLLLGTEFFMLLAGSRPQDVVAIGTAAGWVMVFVWMAFARRLLVHAILVLTLVVVAQTADLRGGGDLYGPFISSNVIAMIVGGLVTRRVRRNTITAWTERHAQAVEQLRMRDELALARQVQLSMLPAAPPQLPWLDVAAISLPATEVGGDYYDYFAFDGKMAIVCGDVAGHGFASGIVLAALRSGFTLLRESLGDPARVLIRLHELIEETSRRRMLTTVAVVSLDPRSRRAKIASAGHPPVMLRSNGAVRAIELFGPPLGVRLPISIAQTELEIQPGDVFVLHSDGVYETVNASGELYGLDRLAAATATANGSAAEVLDAILADVNQFRGAEAQSDDVTVVVAAVHAAG